MTTAVDQIGARLQRIDQLFAAVAPVAAPPASSFAGALAAAQTPAGATNAVTQTPSAVPPAVAPVAGQTSNPFGAEIDAAAARNGIDPALLTGLVRQESGFDPGARSAAGAVGLTQLMPGTAAELGVTDPTDPAQALEGGARYLRQQLDRFGGDPSKALAAYNAGPGAVERFGAVPPYAETQAYVKAVLGYAAQARIGAPS